VIDVAFFFLTTKISSYQYIKNVPIFPLWKDGALRAVFEALHLTVVDFFRAISKIRMTDVWLGYVFKKQGFRGNQRIV